MHYAQFFEQHVHLLTSLGWPPEPAALRPAAKAALTRLGFDVRDLHVLTTPAGSLAVVRLRSHQLPEPSAVVRAFVETTWETRSLLQWCAQALGAQAALLIDPCVTWLHRLAAGDHCLVVTDGQGLEERLLPLFAAEADPVAAILAHRRESTEAQGRALRQWLQLWERRLGEACGLPTSEARRLIQQLLLVRKCRDLGWPASLDSLARPLARPLELLEREEIEAALGQALRAVDLLDRHLGLLPCRRGPTERQRTEEALARSELTAGALLRSIELLAVAHLTTRVWLAAEAEPELQRASWRLTVEDPHPMARHGAGATPHDAGRLRLDVLEVGYEYPLHVTAAAVQWIAAFNASLSTEYAAARRSAFQPDFLTLADGGADPAGFITDPLHFALRHLVEIVATLPLQNRLMKWLLTLRLLELIQELGLPPQALPDLDRYC